MLLHAFLQQCQNRPEALAVVEGDEHLSYRQVLERASAVAAALRGLGIGPGQRVAIYMERGAAAVGAVFGVLLAGAAYVPLDVKNPPARLGFIVRDADVAAAVGLGAPPGWLDGPQWLDLSGLEYGGSFHSEGADIDPLSLWERVGVRGSKKDFFHQHTLTEHPFIKEEIPFSPLTLTLSQGERGQRQNPSLVRGQRGLNRPDDPAAILYTSGSTGQPKGVALSHGAVWAFAEWAADLVDLGSDDRIAASAPLFFDLSTFDLYAVLGRGASLHFLPPHLTLAPARLSAWLREQAITGWYTVPSLLAFLAYKGNLAATPLEGLRFLLFAGEVFPTSALIHLAEHLPATQLFNLFGPTETNVCCHWPVDRARLDPARPIPIGAPAAGAELRIEPDSGELWARGPALASGYWRGGKLEALPGRDGWYPTGDRVSRDERGEYQFHGRLGRMLKCSGHRVEPAEIEAVVHALPAVKACAVVGVDDPAAGQRPGLALVLAEGGTPGAVRRALQQQLPAYMQPGRWRVVDALPVLPNGKLDYRGLQILLESAP